MNKKPIFCRDPSGIEFQDSNSLKNVGQMIFKSFYSGYDAHSVNIYLNKKLDPKQKSIQKFSIDAKKVKKTKYDNPPMQKI